MLKPGQIIFSISASLVLLSFTAAKPAFAQATAEAPINWAETLRDSLTLNNKPKSKDALLAAQKILTDVAKDAMLPTAGSSYTFSQAKSNLNSAGTPSTENVRFGEASANVSWTIFQCGTSYYNYKAARVNEKILADQFNSTQFFIPNTKGGVVASAFQAYKTLIQLDDLLKMFPTVMNYFTVLAPIADQDPDAKASLQIVLQQTQAALVTLEQSQKSAIEVYKHWVTVTPGADLYDLQHAIDELIIPPTWSEAYQIAIVKSPDVRQASEQMELAENQIKSARAAMCPAVSVSASYTQSNSFDSVSNTGSKSGGAQAGFGISFTLWNKANRDVVKYNKTILKADRLAKDAALDDAQFSLQQTYKDLQDQSTNQKINSALLQQLLTNIRNSESDIEHQIHLPDPHTSGAVNSFITSKLASLENLTTTWSQLTTVMSEILQDKFSVLQAEGTLFDSNDFK